MPYGKRNNIASSLQDKAESLQDKAGSLNIKEAFDKRQKRLKSRKLDGGMFDYIFRAKRAREKELARFDE